MKHMTRFNLALAAVLAAVLSAVPSARADFFGGDLPLLTEIVVNTAQELTQLESILTTGNQDLALVQEINHGINDSMNMIRTVFPNVDAGVFKNWNTAASAIEGITALYGAVAPSKAAPVQKNTDQSVAEAIALNNSVYTYTAQIDDLSESIKAMSHDVSPGGAGKLTAESLAVMLAVMNQSLRTQATGLKLQAESLALQNRQDKEGSRYLLENTQALQLSMEAQDTTFELPTL